MVYRWKVRGKIEHGDCRLCRQMAYTGERGSRAPEGKQSIAISNGCRLCTQVAYTGEKGIGRMGEGDRMVRDLARGGHATIDQALAASDIRIFGDGSAGNGAISSAAAADGAMDEGGSDEAGETSSDESGEEHSGEEEEAEDGDLETTSNEGANRPLTPVG